jgi:hypothetical protein
MEKLKNGMSEFLGFVVIFLIQGLFGFVSLYYGFSINLCKFCASSERPDDYKKHAGSLWKT